MTAAPYIPATATTRAQLAAAIHQAAPAWDAWITARDEMTAAWANLVLTRNSEFLGAVLGLLSTHDAAMEAATAWDEHAQGLAWYTLQDEDGHLTTWRDMADEVMGLDVDAWEVEAATSYPSPRAVVTPRGPLATQAHRTITTHRDRLADLATITGTGGLARALEVER